MLNDIRHIFIINPAAGKGSEAQPVADKIRDACDVAGAEYEIYMTKQRGDGTAYVRQRVSGKKKDEMLRFYACGGDGTLNEVICGAVNPALDGSIPGVEVGCVPIGTGNDFVRNFSTPEFFKDIPKQLLGDAISLDCFAYNERCGINMVNVGFDCDVVSKAAELKQKPLIPKNFAYLAGIAVVLRKNLGKSIRIIRSDGSEFSREFELCAVANGGFCGGGFHSAPIACLDDGLLDISLMRKVSRTTFLRLVGSYKEGTHLKSKLGRKVVSYIQDTSVTFQFEEETDVCVDGEIERVKEAVFRVLPKAVRFVLPVGVSCLCTKEAMERGIVY
ncbi:MAG: YegS/Rv2252/BmrU family lipid kinase [Clostridia bacterium]|nr:YegS/Rv2252/BmrU family lipid kinase [Clostridia bacterium]